MADISVTQAIILGIVQGLTEFLPVSSSAHLVLVPWALQWQLPENMMAFDVALHIGTLLAVILFFFFDWLMIIASYIGDLRQGNWLGGSTGSLLPKIVISTVPAAAAGMIFEEPIENFFYKNVNNIWALAITMTLFGLALLLAERYGKQARDVKHLTYQDAMIVGCFQALALIPGTSRSGVTIMAALLLGLARPAAARFSFLAALPITFGAVVLKSRDLGTAESWAPLIAGILASAVVGIIAIKGLLQYVQTRSYAVFAYYRWVVAAGILAIYFTRR